MLIIRYVYYHYQNETKPLKAPVDLKSLLFGTVVHGSLKRYKTLNSASLSHNYPVNHQNLFFLIPKYFLSMILTKLKVIFGLYTLPPVFSPLIIAAV